MQACMHCFDGGAEGTGPGEDLLEPVAAGVGRLLPLAAGQVHQVEARVPLLRHALRRHKRALHLPPMFRGRTVQVPWE